MNGFEPVWSASFWPKTLSIDHIRALDMLTTPYSSPGSRENRSRMPFVTHILAPAYPNQTYEFPNDFVELIPIAIYSPVSRERQNRSPSLNAEQEGFLAEPFRSQLFSIFF